MKAVYIMEPGKMEVRENPIPAIEKDDDIIIKVKYTGICGSDVHILKGENPFVSFPRIFGHEFCGIVEKTGSAVTNVKAGDHVIIEPIEYCGKCYPCRIGHPNVCKDLKLYGVHADGGCQEYFRCPAVKAHVIDPEVPLETAVLAEPLTIGFRVNNRAQTLPGDVVLIQGTGAIGLCIMLAAKSKGATVIMTDIVPSKLEYAKSLGADYVINAAETDVKEEVMKITDGMGANVIADSVCNKKSLEASLDMVSLAGRIVELGFGTSVSEIPHIKIFKDVSVMGTRLQAGEFPEVIRYLEKNYDKLSGFVNAKYPPEKAEEAFAYAIEHADKVRKIVIEF